MKKIIAFLLFIALPIILCAQTIKSPTYSRRDNISLNILEIERTINYTIIRGVYTNIMSYGWASIGENTRLIDKKTGYSYKIIKSEGLPISPNKYQFTKENESLNFTFYFHPIGDEAELIDLIEDSQSTSAFNFYDIALKDNITREFKISRNKGQLLNYKPSLATRLNGVKEVQVYIPRNLTQLDKYIYGNFIEYLHELGLRADVVSASFENKSVQMGTVSGFYRVFNEDVGNYLKDANTLAAVVNYSCTSGQYVSGTSLAITFVDYINEFTWSIPSFDIPNKGEKLIKKLKNSITNYYNYNSNYSFIPPSITSNWNERILKEHILKNGADPLEGIYKGDKYTLGVKKSDDGTYYIIYLDGADNLGDWHEGDIKATLSNTASAILFKADWLGKWKQNMEQTISFSNIGFVAQDIDGEKDSYIKMFPSAEMVAESVRKNSVSSGTGFLLTKDGYIITNNHVIEEARTIKITGINDDYHTSYKAIIEITDPQNDLAILKIKDEKFNPISSIPYSFKFNTSSVGEDCFVLGYPLISSMGTDIKLTTGIISSKTGYAGNVSEYQISAPVQPGNSGAPLFDKNGNIIGVVKAKHTEAENAGYAVKASYIRNLVELLPTSITLSYQNQLTNKTLPKQVELASKAVCLIIVNEE